MLNLNGRDAHDGQLRLPTRAVKVRFRGCLAFGATLRVDGLALVSWPLTGLSQPSIKSLDASPQTGYRQAMKVANHSPRRRKVNFQSDSFSLSNAKTYLGRLVEKAGKGQTVYIFRGEHRFILQKVPPIDPIPIRPPGYFANCYSKEEVQEQNRLAKTSVLRAPADLE
jgi:hypothetical protein